MANAFSELPQALDEGRGYEQIRAAEVEKAFDGGDIDDATALKFVLQDVTVAETFFQSKTLSADFNMADDLFRAFVAPRNWPNSNIARSNIPMPVVMEAIETLLPQAHMAFFSDPQPFLLEPKGRTTAEAARGMSHIGCWSVAESGFEEECRKLMKSSLLYGQCIGKFGWKKEQKARKKYKRGADREIRPSIEYEDTFCPTFEYIDVRQVCVDPFHKNHDVRGAAYVIQQNFIDAEELDSLRDQGYDNVPTRAQIALILAERAEATKDSIKSMKIQSWREYQPAQPDEQRSANPLKQPLEILEYWTDDRVITVLQRCIVLRNEPNEFGKKPFLSCAFIDVLNSFWGMGIAKLLEGEQKFQTGVLNAGVDGLSLKLCPFFIRKKGMGTTSQNIIVGPGRAVNEEELTPVPMENVFTDALEALNSSEIRASRRVGSNYGPEMPTQAMRTAEGVQAFTSGVQVRLQYFIEQFADLVFTPAINAFLELAKDNLTEEQVKHIVYEQSGQDYSGDVLDMYNGKYSVEVLSSTKLTQRRSMAQMIPLMMQMLGQPAVQQSMVGQGKKFDYVEFIEQVFDVTGWPSTDLVVAATPQEQQQTMIAMNPQLGKAMADNQREEVKHKNTIDQIREKGEVQAANDTLKHVMSEASQAKELTGGAMKASAQAAEPLANQPQK